MAKTKLLIVGSDSMSHRIAKNLVWPKNGQVRMLASTEVQVNAAGGGKKAAWLTGPNWGSIYTGVIPDKHGITAGGWLTDHENWLRLKVETIWDLLLIRGRSIGMMTMPITWPAIPGFDWMVAGFPAPDDMRGCFEPLKVSDHMPAGFTIDWLNQGMSKRSWIRGVREHLRDHEAAQNHLFGVARQKTDFLFALAKEIRKPEVIAIGYTILDRTHHAFPSGHGFTLKAYEFQRDLVAELVEKLKPEKYIVVSDHGSLPDDLWHDAEGTLITKDVNVPKGALKNTQVKKIIQGAL